MSAAAGATADFLAFLAEEGEPITLTRVVLGAQDSAGNQAETLTNYSKTAWLAAFNRREIDGNRVHLGDVRCWASMASGEPSPDAGWRVTRGGVVHQVLGVAPGPSGVGDGILELHLRRST